MTKTAQVVFESPRQFEVWHWGVGHKGLLLRSNPVAEVPTRIELWFKPAEAVCLPGYVDGVTISIGEAADIAFVNQQLGWTWLTGSRLFRLESVDAVG